VSAEGEETLNLVIEKPVGKPFDGRRQGFADIVDRDTGATVGTIQSHGPSVGGGISVAMYGGKYRAHFHRRTDCYAFVKGVEAVLKYTLDHLVSTENHAAKDDMLNVAGQPVKLTLRSRDRRSG
jgi:hypothetical protein